MVKLTAFDEMGMQTPYYTFAITEILLNILGYTGGYL